MRGVVVAPFPPLAAIIFCCPLLCGCRETEPDLPDTFPVAGEVRGPDGKPVAKGLIQFHAEDNPALNVSAPIVNGKFTLVTVFGSATRRGAIPGRYRVSVTPEFELIPQTVELRNVCEVAPQSNELLIQLDSNSVIRNR